MNGTQRLWARDATLWTGKDEARWLGWLDIVEAERAALPELKRLAGEIAGEGFKHVVVIGMGGSSLCPDVLARVFGPQSGHPELRVMDSTDPSQIAALEEAIDLKKTLFVVSSKSGSTLEPSIVRDYFLARVRDVSGAQRAGRQFIGITDPGSQLEQQAKADGFRTILHGVPEIGGRFSALSHFGMAPAALAGFDVEALLQFASFAVKTCHEEDPARNLGVRLGVLMAEAAAQGRDKLTLITSPTLSPFGSWLEQLIAESTGKGGHMVLPIDGESVDAPDRYGDDRLFVYLTLDSDADAQWRAVDALAKAGHPVDRMVLKTLAPLGSQFFHWEFATAVCGAIMGLNPFDQPDVESAKVATREVTAEVERTGALPVEEPFFSGSGVALFADEANAAAITGAAEEPELAPLLRAHLARAGAGDYLALLAFLEMNDANGERLESIRHLARDFTGVATTTGFGPRYLHSTGQAHKGGPNSGVFIIITCDEARDLPVPGRRYSFGTVKTAQALGDFAVLAERGRRLLRVHLGADVAGGLAALEAAVQQAVA